MTDAERIVKPRAEWARLQVEFQRRLVPDGKRPGAMSSKLAQRLVKAEVELTEAEDCILYERVHKQGHPFNKELASLWMLRGIAIVKELEAVDGDLLKEASDAVSRQ